MVTLVTGLILVGGLGAAGVWQAAQAEIGLVFLVYLVPALLAVAIIPALGSVIYALRSASYTMERDGMRLRWGLRIEEFPMRDVLWVHRAQELKAPLTLPRLKWPGVLRGMGHLHGAGEVEFMATQAQNLVLIATPERIYAISPGDPQVFLASFESITEMGSLFPLAARSQYPTVLLQRVWQDRLARGLLLSGAGLSLALMVWVSLAIPGRSQAVLGFLPDASPGEPGPAVRLLLLPVINSIFFLINMLLGLFFFRRQESQSLSYLLWGSAAFTAFLFLVAAGLLLRLPG
jgi:hypothetical protein